MVGYIIRTGLWGLILLLSVRPAAAFELAAGQVKITCEDQQSLVKFNRELVLGRRLSLLARQKNVETSTDEIINKIDIITEKVQLVLQMAPDDLQFTLAILPSKKEVQAVFHERYGQDVDYIAFYSPKAKTVYVSAREARLDVLSHEIAHAVIDAYFKVKPPVKIHEVLAQYASAHIND